MTLFSLISPSAEKAFFFFLILIAANFPYIGTYHTELGYTNCLQDRLIKDCNTVYERQLHLNPVFWFPYVAVQGSGLLLQTADVQTEWLVPFLEFQSDPKYFPLVLTAVFWYLVACIMSAPITREVRQKE
ncbi:MAG: hypothetical protein ABIG96_05780 [Candidatus Micrarchaeota archaeon]